MHIRLRVWPVDLVGASLRAFVTSGWNYGLALGATGLVLLVALWRLGVPRSAEAWGVYLTACVIGGGACLLVGAALTVALTGYSVARGAAGVGEQSLRLSPEGLYHTRAGAEVFVAWSMVKTVKVSGPYLMLRMPDQAVLVVPQRGFRSSEAFALYASEAITQWRESRSVQRRARSAHLLAS